MNAGWLRYFPQFIQAKLEGRDGLQAVISNSGWLFVDKILRMGVGLFVGVWIARYLGPGQYGLWNYAIAFAALFSTFATLGLDGVVVRELVRKPELKNQLLGSAFLLKLAGGIIALSFAASAIAFMRIGETLVLWLVILSAAGFIFQSANVVDFYFQAKVQSRYTVYAANCAFLFATLLKIYLLITSASLIAFALVGFLEVVLTSFLLMAVYRVNRNKILSWELSWPVARMLLVESWPLMLAGLAVTLYMRVDMVMLGAMADDVQVGIYGAATRLSEVWYLLPTVIVASVSPSLINCRGISYGLYCSRLKRLYFLMFWMAIGVALPLSLLSDMIISILYGAAYEGAGPVLALHLWSSIAVFLGVASSQYLLIEGLQNISFYRTLIGLISNVVLNLLLIPTYGAWGAALATVVAYFVATFSIVFFKKSRAHTLLLLRALFVWY